MTQANKSLRPDQGELTFSSKKEKICTVEQRYVWPAASLSIYEKVLEQCPPATIQSWDYLIRLPVPVNQAW